MRQRIDRQQDRQPLVQDEMSYDSLPPTPITHSISDTFEGDSIHMMSLMDIKSEPVISDERSYGGYWYFL